MELSDHLPKPGSLLIAPPALQDPNFFRSVILLCEHSGEGSFGLILNRPIEAEIEIMSSDLAGYTGGLQFGGPVQPDTLHFLHKLELPEAATIVTGVEWGGDFDALKQICSGRSVSDRELRLFLGYAGWGAGQLHDEIQTGGWIVTESDEKAVFSDEPGSIWRSRLRRMGGDYAVMANFPIDPRLN
ncbi:MAG: YqgE/AlgH family protein [Rhodothermia bacterium]|nr:YqgE/AlgH family protein [Rhodothermia bacterium]